MTAPVTLSPQLLGLLQTVQAVRQCQAAAPASELPSPCVGVCRIDPDTGLCQGCWRQLDEIARWRDLGRTARLAVWDQVQARMAAHFRTDAR